MSGIKRPPEDDPAASKPNSPAAKAQRLLSSIANVFSSQEEKEKVVTEGDTLKSSSSSSSEQKDISKCPFFSGKLGRTKLKPNLQTEEVSTSKILNTEQDSTTGRRVLKNMVLTGGSRGIGHATVKRFSSSGWRVITLSRQAFPTKGECPWIHGKEDHVQVDLSDPKQVEEAVKTIRERLKVTGGKLDALVNNAAISPKDEEGNRIGLLETDMSVWQKTFQVNFFAPIQLARGLYPELKKAKGSVVNVTSIVGTRVHPFAGSAYATTKAALFALTREMASDLGKDGIRVNAISPGEIDTSILSPGTEKIVENEIPMKRLGTTDEVAKAIFFLCTDASSYVSGTELHINGAQHV